MKKMKQIIALLVAMVMVLGMMTMTAFAADPTGSITIKPAVTDPQAATTTYEAYKIFDMTTDGTLEDGKYTTVAYTINSAWADFFKTGAPGAAYISDTNTGSLNQIAIGGATKYINITDSNVAAFAKAAYKYAMENNIAAAATKTANKGDTSVKFENLPLGYYMVYPRGASINIDSYTSIVSLTSTDPDAEIAQKAKYPTLTKEADDISVEVGQKVTYTLGSTVPDTTGYSKYNMVFADTTTAGLTFDGASSITVKIGTATLVSGTDYTVDTTTPDFKVTINMLKNTGTAADPVYEAKYTYDDKITVTYTATVNSAAVTKIDENHATLTYNNNPKDDDEVGTTPPVVVKTYSSKLQIEKVDANNKTKKLPGAVFVLRAKTPNTNTGDKATAVAGRYYKFTAAAGTTAAKTEWIAVSPDAVTDLIAAANAGTITAVTTDDNGLAAFEGLEDGVYELVEIVAPAGYNLLTTPKEVTIAGSDSDDSLLTVQAEVENKSGSLLPSTGGIGTTIFYVLGALLVLGAGVVLVTRRRMDA